MVTVSANVANLELVKDASSSGPDPADSAASAAASGKSVYKKYPFLKLPDTDGESQDRRRPIMLAATSVSDLGAQAGVPMRLH